MYKVTDSLAVSKVLLESLRRPRYPLASCHRRRTRVGIGISIGVGVDLRVLNWPRLSKVTSPDAVLCGLSVALSVGVWLCIQPINI